MKTTPVTPRKKSATHQLKLDEKALARAKADIGDGAVTPSYGPWRDAIVDLLNRALATELVCVLRYRRHHFTAKGLASGPIADEFLVHAIAEQGHADRIAERRAGRKVEGDGRGRELALMVDCQRRVGRFETRKGRQRHLPAGLRPQPQPQRLPLPGAGAGG